MLRHLPAALRGPGRSPGPQAGLSSCLCRGWRLRPSFLHVPGLSLGPLLPPHPRECVPRPPYWAICPVIFLDSLPGTSPTSRCGTPGTHPPPCPSLSPPSEDSRHSLSRPRLVSSERMSLLLSSPLTTSSLSDIQVSPISVPSSLSPQWGPCAGSPRPGTPLGPATWPWTSDQSSPSH